LCPQAGEICKELLAHRLEMGSILMWKTAGERDNKDKDKGAHSHSKDKSDRAPIAMLDTFFRLSKNHRELEWGAVYEGFEEVEFTDRAPISAITITAGWSRPHGYGSKTYRERGRDRKERKERSDILEPKFSFTIDVSADLPVNSALINPGISLAGPGTASPPTSARGPRFEERRNEPSDKDQLLSLNVVKVAAYSEEDFSMWVDGLRALTQGAAAMSNPLTLEQVEENKALFRKIEKIHQEVINFRPAVPPPPASFDFLEDDSTEESDLRRRQLQNIGSVGMKWKRAD